MTESSRPLWKQLADEAMQGINTRSKPALSPAAQAVLDAVLQFKFGEEADEVDYPRMSRILGPELAAAFTAAALYLNHDCQQLLAIAAELEAEPEPATEESSATQPADGEVAELCVWLRANSSGIYRPAARAADLLERIPVLEAELERERIRLAACGVIAMADTPDSATAARDIAPEYQSASAQDVARMVDKLMRLRQQPPPPTQTKPEPPADGEVAETVTWLREEAQIAWTDGCPVAAGRFTRAADLLSRLAPQPVPVSEQLPRGTDCDAEGRCWRFCPEDDSQWDRWSYCRSNGNETHWLPAHALPLPAGDDA